ncbi:hypothetical protein, partial [Endozoicomonas atrinae]|uniref:hypothetical protein n=1 Tax=Endozoicomonas atrinae TaxID=1333660 RepID=UPI0019310C17
THPFTGQYHGQCHTISNLSDCFVKKLDQGSISHLRFIDAHITSSKTAGLAACTVNGTVSDIQAENVHITTSGEYADAGIGGGVVLGTVANTTAVNSTVETSGKNAEAAIGGGLVESGGTVANTTAVNSTVNGTLKNLGHISDDQLQLLCQKADQRVLTANCSSRTEWLDALDFSHSDVCPVNAATASTAATVGITTGSLFGAAAGLGIAGYSTYQWITGYREGLRGQALAMKPLTRGRELGSAAANAVSQGILGIRERMNRQSVPTQEPAHEISQVPTQSV